MDGSKPDIASLPLFAPPGDPNASLSDRPALPDGNPGNVRGESPGSASPPPRPELYPRYPSLPIDLLRPKAVDVELLRRSRRSNAVWQRNRLFHWGRRRDVAWFTFVGGATILMLGASAAAADAFPRGGGLLLTVLGVLFLQLALGNGMIRWFDFVGGRRETLEELGATPLTPDAIAYGSFSSGVRAGFWVLGGLLAGEVEAAILTGSRVGMGPYLVLVVLFLIPGHFLVQCALVESALESRSEMSRRFSFRRTFSTVLVVGQTSTHWAAYFLALLLVGIGGIFGIPLFHVICVVAALALLAMYARFLGRQAVESGYRKAAKNYRKALEWA